MTNIKPSGLRYRMFAGLLTLALMVGLLPISSNVNVASASSTPAADKPAVVANDDNQTQHQKVSDKLERSPLDTSVKVEKPEKKSGPTAIMIELSQDPAALVYAANKDKSESAATNAVQSRLAEINTAQRQVLAQLNSVAPSAQVIYQTKNAFNGIAVIVDVAQIDALAKLPNVKSVRPIATHTLDNASSVPLIGAPQTWTSYGITGANIKIGIIDTGIDYLHTNFGGPGTYTGYNDTVITDTPGLFPGPKVAGGYDFAGNNYDANGTGSALIPQPDPDPLDCAASLGGGHGSHVAGTSAGLGVNADGTTYAGPYNNSTPFSSLRIGPGVAPGAKLYALRVFGCTGSTNLTTEAIDWSVDPNGDGNFSDHLDVINMSLGSSYGSPDDSSVVASNNAAVAGVQVVASAGNSYESFYVSGTPGTATQALSVASSVDALDVTDLFRVDAPASISGTYTATNSANFNWQTFTSLTRDIVYLGTINAANPAGCTAYNSTEAAAVNDKFVLVDWIPGSATTFPCGSAVRANNAAAAGAKGILMANNKNIFDTSIAGNATIPAQFTTKYAGDAIKGALASGPVTITFSSSYNQAGRALNPGAVDTISSFTSRGPRNYDNALKPDIAAPGQTIFSTASGTGNRGETLSGTSMAAPHMAGVMALLRQKNPTWTVQELKALAMNTANHDLFTGDNLTGNRYSPSRVGSGRVDVPQAISNTVIAADANNAAAVSLSFNLQDVVTGTTSIVTKTVKVTNKGASAANYTVSYDSLTDNPGASYSFPDGTSVSVPATSTATFRVVLTVVGSQIQNLRDSTTPQTQTGTAGTFQRLFINEETGIVKLVPTSGITLRVPVHAVLKKASDMKATTSNINFASSIATTTIGLSGSGIFEGFSNPTQTLSLVNGFELQSSSSPAITVSNPPTTPLSTREADIKYVGISSDAKSRIDASSPISNANAYFAISTYGNWSNPATAEFDVYIDTNRDGVDDYVLYNFQNGTSTQPNNIYLTNLVKLTGGTGSSLQGFVNDYDGSLYTNLLNSNIIVLPVSLGSLGITSTTNSRFNYRVVSFARFADNAVDTAGPFTYDPARPGVDFNDGGYYLPYYFDIPTNSLPVYYNSVNYAANNSKGILLFHNHNTDGKREQVISIGGGTGNFHPLPQFRLYDSRTAFGGPGPFAAGETRTITATNNTGISSNPTSTVTIPSSAKSIVVNFTAVQVSKGGFLTAYQTGITQPLISTLNWYYANQIVGNSAIVDLSSAGQFNAYFGASAGDLTVDVVGYYDNQVSGPAIPASNPLSSVLTTTALTYQPVSSLVTSVRAYDSRPAFGGSGPLATGATRTVQVRGTAGVPSTAKAVIINLTAINAVNRGFLAAYPGSSNPGTASVSFNGSVQPVVGNLVVVYLDSAGAITVLAGGTNTSADFVIDVFGYYDDSNLTVGGYVGLPAPVRHYDSRTSQGGLGPISAGQTITAAVSTKFGTSTPTGVPSTARAVVIHLAVANTVSNGYLALYGVNYQGTSSLNWAGNNQLVSNLAVVDLNQLNSLKVLAGGNAAAKADFIIDIVGYIP